MGYFNPSAHRSYAGIEQVFAVGAINVVRSGSCSRYARVVDDFISDIESRGTERTVVRPGDTVDFRSGRFVHLDNFEISVLSRIRRSSHDVSSRVSRIGVEGYSRFVTSGNGVDAEGSFHVELRCRTCGSDPHVSCRIVNSSGHRVPCVSSGGLEGGNGSRKGNEP